MEVSVHKLLEGNKDPYGGFIVDDTKLPDKSEFEHILKATLESWFLNKVRGVWLKIPITQSELIPIAVAYQFIFHHAEPNYLMLVRWLPSDEPSTLPDFASHTVGVGGFVVDDKNQVLVVSERYGADKPRQWKLPGGYVKPGETLAQAAIREVKEETGVDSEFVSVVCFRHFHPLMFNKSDIYFVVRLKPLSFEIKAEEAEIADCQWLHIDEYKSDPNVNGLNRQIAELVLKNIQSDKSYEIIPQQVESKWKTSFYEFYTIPQ